MVKLDRIILALCMYVVPRVLNTLIPLRHARLFNPKNIFELQVIPCRYPQILPE